tara:strand:+ start:467 stop:640 length:174 start_codon:yes stop_codon:yes gene_type:complete
MNKVNLETDTTEELYLHLKEEIFNLNVYKVSGDLYINGEVKEWAEFFSIIVLSPIIA